MRRTPLMLLLLFNTACHTAVIPLSDNEGLDSLGNDLQSEAAAFLDDVFHHVNSPQTSSNDIDQGQISPANTDDIDNKLDYEGEVYSLDEGGRFVLGSSIETSANLDAPDESDNHQIIPISPEDSTFEHILASTSFTTAADASDGGDNSANEIYPEDGDILGEDEFILDEDEDIGEDGDDEDLEDDSESVIPFFRNKHEEDFNFDTLDILADDEHPILKSDPSPSFSKYRLSFSHWQFLLGAGLVFLVLKLVTVQAGHGTRSLTEATTSYTERRKQMSHKYEQAAARRLPIHTQDLTRKSTREHPPPSFVFPTIPEEEDEDEERHFDKYSRRASAGHIRRPPASGSGRGPSFNHIRHASLNGKYPL